MDEEIRDNTEDLNYIQNKCNEIINTQVTYIEDQLKMANEVIFIHKELALDIYKIAEKLLKEKEDAGN